MAIDETRMNELLGHAVGDFGASFSAPLVMIGDELGLYRALADIGPATPADVAERTGTRERYVREWLLSQAAGGYVDYDPADRRFSMNQEQRAALVDEDSPYHVLGGFQIAQALWADREKIAERFRTGDGLHWGDHDEALYDGTRRFFEPGYRANIVPSWIPALDGVEGRLRDGARVADVGCGLGASTVIMAEAFPRSEFHGFDYHAASIEAAREQAQSAGVGDRVHFDTAAADDYDGGDYALVTCFDCLHDMADPEGAARHIHETLSPDGALMLVEPRAEDAPEDNLNPVGRVFYSASTMLCVPNALCGDGDGLGAQAGEARLTELLRGAGFSSVRRAAETPFNMVLEARA
jgi:2-polyprenyl-3-methyl-5-hydroxy-6-metoxy-1,4-benzoquinol methylase